MPHSTPTPRGNYKAESSKTFCTHKYKRFNSKFSTICLCENFVTEWTSLSSCIARGTTMSIRQMTCLLIFLMMPSEKYMKRSHYLCIVFRFDDPSSNVTNIRWQKNFKCYWQKMLWILLVGFWFNNCFEWRSCNIIRKSHIENICTLYWTRFGHWNFHTDNIFQDAIFEIST